MEEMTREKEAEIEEKKTFQDRVYDEVADYIPRMILLRDSWEQGLISNEEFLVRIGVRARTVYKRAFVLLGDIGK